MDSLLSTISKLKWWSINYHIDTAQTAERASSDLQWAHEGVGEYYSEHETRTPVWLFAARETDNCANYPPDDQSVWEG
jgi:hypothetical protein